MKRQLSERADNTRTNAQLRLQNHSLPRLCERKKTTPGFVTFAGSQLRVLRPSAASPCEPTRQVECLLLTAEGKVEVSPVGQTEWTTARTNQVLRVGDRVRTGARSRSTIRLTNLSVLRVNELTTLQIQAPSGTGQQPGLDLKSGAAYFFHRDRPEEMQFRTPLASGAIRGTEFHLAVAEDGRTELAVLNGEVDLKNDLAQVILKSGEQGIVEKGRPPTKTAVISAINLIQWTLYYPGVLDVDELALTADEKQRIAESLEAYRKGDLLAALKTDDAEKPPGSDAEGIYRAALLLAVGQVEQTEKILASLNPAGDRAERITRLANALRRVIAAVKFQTDSQTLDLRRPTLSRQNCWPSRIICNRVLNCQPLWTRREKQSSNHSLLGLAGCMWRSWNSALVGFLRRGRPWKRDWNSPRAMLKARHSKASS